MGKGKWGKPAYKGSVDPISSANYFMFVIILLLFLGFVQAGINKGWFTAIVDYISQ